MAFTRRSFLAGLAACPLCAAAARAEGAHWTYDDPEHWGAHDETAKACSLGAEQSPIDLTDAVKADTRPPKLGWKPQAFEIVNNGHTIQANAAGGVAELGGRKFELKQFHFHTPSEHALGGKRLAMEAHFVHAGDNGDLLVVGSFLVAGAPNKAFSAVMAAAPKEEGKAALKAPLDASALLPKGKKFFRYEGSLTTPPCSEVAHWNVFAEPVAVAQADIDAFKTLFPMNARPLQPTHRRIVLSGG
ncbi:carbonic anhydrase [Methylosinus sporium]|uniref:carbonic anhydrase n=1 Tax=Methylosinus sporium TaxID=428 RepID=A0A2U1SV93_METSR|nr:carbonic anhydrase family protein [Methylosinus sporium]PWB95530.1 carbonate dehydratase [Methylosinus sporium]